MFKASRLSRTKPRCTWIYIASSSEWLGKYDRIPGRAGLGSRRLPEKPSQCPFLRARPRQLDKINTATSVTLPDERQVTHHVLAQ